MSTAPSARPARAAVLLAACAVSALACQGRDPVSPPPPPVLDLTVRAAAQETRAGRVRAPEELLGGTIQRGRVGDFKLYNDKVAFIIAGPGAGNGYSPWGGKLLDADIVRAPNEPGRARFGEFVLGFDQRVSSATTVEVVSAGGVGKTAQIRVMGTDVGIPLLDVILDGIIPARDRHLKMTTDYLLEPGASYLRIRTTLENVGTDIESFQMRQLSLLFGDGAKPYAPGIGFDIGVGPSPYYAAIADEVSYGIFDTQPINLVVGYQALFLASQGAFSLVPSETRTFEQLVAVGAGDTASLVRAHAAATNATLQVATIRARVVDAGGVGLPGYQVHALQRFGASQTEHVAVGRTSTDGSFALEVYAAGDYDLWAIADGQPPSVAGSASVTTLGTTVIAKDLAIPESGTLRVRVTDETGAALPAKLFFERVGLSAVSLSSKLGAQSFAGGAARIVYGRGAEERVRLEAGRYKVTASRGFEYTIAQQDLVVATGADTPVTFQLKRVVDTTGWLSGDFHIHAQASPDSDDLDELKVAAFAAEGLEVPVTTDHESVSDYMPTIERLGLQKWMHSVVGEEVTTFSLGHFNAFPLARQESEWNHGAVKWHFKAGPEIFAAIRQNPGRPVLQINHPRSGGSQGYFTAVDYDPVTRTPGRPRDWSRDFDAIEVVNGKRVIGGVTDTISGVFADWYSFLDEGKRVTGNGNSDSHHALEGAEPGYPRNYVKVPTDDLAAFDEAAFVDGVRRGRVVVSGGPFLSVSIGGKGPGSDVTVTGGTVPIDVVVQAAPWMDVTEIIVVGNSDAVATRDITAADADPQNPVVRFRGTIEVPAAQDTWYVVHVRGTRPMDPVVSGARPFAFSNPIYVDVDGDGRFTAPLSVAAP